MSWTLPLLEGRALSRPCLVPGVNADPNTDDTEVVPPRLGFKLLQQRRRTGDIAPRHHRSGRKPLIVPAHHRQMRTLLSKKPDLTLKELRAALELECSLPAIHYALVVLGLTYKKRHSVPANRIGPTSRGRVGRGSGGRAALTRPG